MAQIQKLEYLRRQALASLEQSRAEISAQAVELRHDLNPAEIARTAFHKHPVWIFAGAAGAGLAIGWLLLRRPPAPVPPPATVRPVAEAARRHIAVRVLSALLPTSLLGPVAAMAVKAALPSLARAAMGHFQQQTKTGG